MKNYFRICEPYWLILANYYFFFFFQDNPDLTKQFHLKPPSFYKYLNQSGCVQIEGISDNKKLDALRLAFQVVQVPPQMVDGIFAVIAAILWLGNLEFEVSPPFLPKKIRILLLTHFPLFFFFFTGYRRGEMQTNGGRQNRAFDRCRIIRSTRRRFSTGRFAQTNQRPREHHRNPPQAPRSKGKSSRHGQSPLLEDFCLAHQSHQHVHKSRPRFLSFPRSPRHIRFRKFRREFIRTTLH